MTWIKGLASLFVALVLAASLHSLRPLFSDFQPRFALYTEGLPPLELALYAFYVPLGLGAASAFARALLATRWPARIAREVDRLDSPWTPWLALPILLGMLFAADRLILLSAPVTDDELTYRFIAQTLIEGRVVNPPPGDEPFFANQFVMIGRAGWYGKYPIGHPLILALGMRAGLDRAIVPLLTCACFLLATAIAARAYSARESSLTALLLLLSPQFVLTGATQLSQPTASLCLLVTILALLRLDRGGGPRDAWVAGTGLGMGLLVRPMPAALFMAVAAAWVAFATREVSLAWRARMMAWMGVPVLVAGLLLGRVHQAQTGDPLTSGYHAFHGSLGTVLETPEGPGRLARITASLVGGLLRQNFWLFGWPLSFALLAFAARNRESALLAGMIAASVAYRILVPKTSVSSTGPVYLAEIVPLLAILSASGLARLRPTLEAHLFVIPAGMVPAYLAGLTFSAATLFLPYPVRDLRRAGEAFHEVHRLLERAGAERALVFADSLTPHIRGYTWVLCPPSPSPDLDDEVIFVRIPREGATDAGVRIHEFWRRRFPDRKAFLFHASGRAPTLVPLERHPPRLELVPRSQD